MEGYLYCFIRYICIAILIISYLDVVLFVVLSSEADDRTRGKCTRALLENQNKWPVNGGYPITAKLSSPHICEIGCSDKKRSLIGLTNQ